MSTAFVPPTATTTATTALLSDRKKVLAGRRALTRSVISTHSLYCSNTTWW
ncbi:hypothetical protein GTY88_09735 [Streptomyces sp. SID5926]|nr:hypothetical protein [Streptomyces sp. SID5926]